MIYNKCNEYYINFYCYYYIDIYRAKLTMPNYVLFVATNHL